MHFETEYTQEYNLDLLLFHWFSLDLLLFHWFSLDLLLFHWFSLDLLLFHWFSLDLLLFHWFSLDLLLFHWFSLDLSLYYCFWFWICWWIDLDFLRLRCWFSRFHQDLLLCFDWLHLFVYDLDETYLRQDRVLNPDLMELLLLKRAQSVGLLQFGFGQFVLQVAVFVDLLQTLQRDEESDSQTASFCTDVAVLVAQLVVSGAVRLDLRLDFCQHALEVAGCDSVLGSDAGRHRTEEEHMSRVSSTHEAAECLKVDLNYEGVTASSDQMQADRTEEEHMSRVSSTHEAAECLKVDLKVHQQRLKVPSGQSAQQHQTDLDSIFMLLQENIFRFVGDELKKIKRVLSLDYPESLESQRENEDVLDGEDEEQWRSSREAFLNITLHFLRSMKQEELADRLHSIAVYLDRVTVYLDRVAVYLDRVAVYLDRVAVYLDRVAVYLDRVAVYLDRVTVYLDRVAVYLDRVAVYLDRVAVYLDRDTVYLDRDTSDFSMDSPIELKDGHHSDPKVPRQRSEVPINPSLQLDSIFLLLEENIVRFVEDELKKIRRVLSSDYPESLESQREEEEVLDGEDEEQRRSSREAFLNITLHFLRSMKQEELADRLHSIPQQSLKVPSGQSAQQHQTDLDSIFMLLQENIVRFVGDELKKIQRVLNSDYPEGLESQRKYEEILDGEDEEQKRSSREAFLNITLHFLRSMKQEELADRLHSIPQQSLKVPSGQSAQQHQTDLDSIFMVCKCRSTATPADSSSHTLSSEAAL
ncbi:hypothetical protein F7725_020063 [Dissostichus mawsoni]|uniref:Uncharacterized protein n=1 Tax=Dissostichus mawsoni TaxID=36200 RepID=A0A7J5YLI3_DISMA|nr:hypothetical protein F7725_020063 [Dissostichus mawsoni]